MKCKNCYENVSGNYCSQCGQRSKVSSITLKDTLQDFVDTVFSVDAPLIRTLKELVVNPGRLFRDFIEGKRKTYYKPVAFFILVTVVYLLVRSIVGFDPLTESAVQVEGATDQLMPRAQSFMFRNINKFLFLFVFWLGLLLKIFFYKKYSLAAYWTIAFYVVGVYNILTIFNMFFVQYIAPDIQYGAIALIGLYFLYAFVSLFKTPVWLIAIKTIFIFYLSFLLYIGTAFGLSYIIIKIIP